MCTHTCEDQRSTPQYLPQSLSTSRFEIRPLSLNLELTDRTRPAGQQAPGVFLSLVPQHCGYTCTLLCWASDVCSVLETQTQVLVTVLCSKCFTHSAFFPAPKGAVDNSLCALPFQGPLLRPSDQTSAPTACLASWSFHLPTSLNCPYQPRKIVFVFIATHFPLILTFFVIHSYCK